MKHVVLTRLLDYLKQKDKPFFYLETHAGKGSYHLQDLQATKTNEYKEGIGLIWENREHLGSLFNTYMTTVAQLNPDNELRYYPGSPYFAIQAARKDDRLYCCELHPAEYRELEQLPCFYKKVHFSQEDGIGRLKALLPPPEKRGLIFIDPSYEIKDEYKTIPVAIKEAYSRFSTGVYCLWYPFVDKKLTEQLGRRMSEINTNKMLHIEFNWTNKSNEGMTGCGLWLINPPFSLTAELKPILTTLKNYLNPGVSSYIIDETPYQRYKD